MIERNFMRLLGVDVYGQKQNKCTKGILTTAHNGVSGRILHSIKIRNILLEVFKKKIKMQVAQNGVFRISLKYLHGTRCPYLLRKRPFYPTLL